MNKRFGRKQQGEGNGYQPEAQAYPQTSPRGVLTTGQPVPQPAMPREATTSTGPDMGQYPYAGTGAYQTGFPQAQRHAEANFPPAQGYTGPSGTGSYDIPGQGRDPEPPYMDQDYAAPVPARADSQMEEEEYPEDDYWYDDDPRDRMLPALCLAFGITGFVCLPLIGSAIALILSLLTTKKGYSCTMSRAGKVLALTSLIIWGVFIALTALMSFGVLDALPFSGIVQTVTQTGGQAETPTATTPGIYY